MFLGYNTNGFAHHRLEDAIEILSDLGYRGIALTLDVHHLDPLAPGLSTRTAALRRQIERRGLQCVIETGARFLLDPRHKHQPTLLSRTGSERRIRLDFLKRCVNIAAELHAGSVSFWSGTPSQDTSPEEALGWLVEGCRELAEYAAQRKVHLAFEPEPGMLIHSMRSFDVLRRRVDHPAFGLTIDIGHLVCNRELPVSRVLEEWKDQLWNIHIEDMRPDVHDHLMFGEGEVDFQDVFAGLRAAGYTGGVFVELSRHSYDAVRTAQRAREFLSRFLIQDGEGV